MTHHQLATMFVRWSVTARNNGHRGVAVKFAALAIRHATFGIHELAFGAQR